MLNYNECYHGTSHENYLAIRNTQKFTYYNRENHWLGQGIYFFIEDKRKASWFVKASSSYHLKNKKKCVIKVEINVEKDDLLNLDTEDGRNKLNKFAKEVKNSRMRIKKREGKTSNAELRCLLIDLYNKYHEIKAVKYTFSDNKIPYKNLNLNDSAYDKIQNTGAQINAIDQSIINFNELSVEYV